MSPHQDAIQDKNQKWALIAHSGTAGTATTVRVVATTAGALTTDQAEVTGHTGGTVSVGTAAVEVTFTGVTQGILITADHDNTDSIYIGGSAVTLTGSGAETRLMAGESITVDLNDASAPIYAVGGTTSQKIYKMAVT